MSGMIKQDAGSVRLYADPSASPVQIRMVVGFGSVADVRLGVSDLHDLRYCIDRVLAQLGERAK